MTTRSAKARCLDKARRLDPPNVTASNETTERAKPIEYSLVELLTDLDIGPMVRKRPGLAGALVLARVCKSLHELVLDETTRARNFWATARTRAHNEGWPYVSHICTENAAATGYLSMLVYLQERGYCWYERTCEKAAENGHLDCLKYVHESGCEWDEETCRAAAEHGHLDCLQYAHENGCPWDEDTCSNAAINGHLPCLQYLHENGCPWDKHTCWEAAEAGHLDCLQYACNNKCPGWEECVEYM